MPEPNHIVVEDLQVAFLLPAKSGNTSVKLALWEMLHREPFKGPNIHDVKHFDYRSLDEIAIMGALDKLTVVGLIREPMARLKSQFAYNRLGKPRSLLSYLRSTAWLDQHSRTQASDLMHKGKVVPGVMLYLETLNEDWRTLSKSRGWPVVSTTWSNTLEDNGLTREPCFELDQPTSQESAMAYARLAADFALYKLLWNRRPQGGRRYADL